MNLPHTTIVGRSIPKEKFYSKTAVPGKLRQQFIDEIVQITWSHKISADTLNITPGTYNELQLFDIDLKKSELSPAVLRHIDTFIPYPILFILHRSNAQKAVIAFKEPSGRNIDRMKVDTYYESKWLLDLELDLKGRSVDEIYRNYLLQIAPTLRPSGSQDIKSIVEQHKSHQSLQKKIDAISRRIANEPSIARKQGLARDRATLEQQIDGII